MGFSVRFDQETDGRWIAEIPEMPGVMAYGKTPMRAFDAVLTLAMRVIETRSAARDH